MQVDYKSFLDESHLKVTTLYKDLIKTVWIKDFDSFNTKHVGELADKVWPSSREERLAIDHILNAHGEGWKDLR